MAKNSWTQTLFDDERAQAGAALQTAQAAGGLEGRMRAIRDATHTLAADDTPRGRLRRYVYIVYALVHHERHGGLRRQDVDQLVTLAYGILRAQGLQPKRSRLSRLYGDLHSIRSQIYRQEGLPWEAAWEQQIAAHLAGDRAAGGEAFQGMVLAGRLLRLGHAAGALAMLGDAELAQLDAKAAARGRLMRAQALFLCGRGAEAETELAAMRAAADGPARETDWQAAVLAAARTGDLKELLRETRREGRFHAAGYVIEACMWAFCHRSVKLLDRLPSIPYLARVEGLDVKGEGEWYACAKTLQSCYDENVPLLLRLNELGERLRRRSELVTIDKELLLWGAALRWLRRCRADDMRVLVEHEYAALSLKLSAGAQADVLGLAREA